MLSETALERREADLARLKQVVRRRPRRRAVVRAGAAGAFLLAALATARQAWITHRGVPIAPGAMVRNDLKSDPPVSDARPAADRIADVGSQGPRFTAVPGVPDAPVRIAGIPVIRTDPAIVSKVLAPNRPISELAFSNAAGVARLDDDGLQRALRAAGEPVGLVRIGRRVLAERDLIGLNAGM